MIAGSVPKTAERATPYPPTELRSNLNSRKRSSRGATLVPSRALPSDPKAGQTNSCRRENRLITRKRVGFIGFDGITGSDLFNASEVLLTAEVDHANGPNHEGYEILVAGLTSRDFVTETGLAIKPDTTLAKAPLLDTIVVPGGPGLRQPEINRTVSEWIKSRKSSTRRIVGLSTGIYALAPTGLLDGRTVATHWRFAGDIASRFPRLKVLPHGFAKDAEFYTSSTPNASMQLMLALIEEDYGTRVAMWVAHDLMVFRQRAGAAPDYLDVFEFQPDAIDRIRTLPAWIQANLHEDLSATRLATQVCLCLRHFMRLFKNVFGCTPADFVEGMRLNEAKGRLASSFVSIEIVARSIGYQSADSFRRAFQRHTGESFARWRARSLLGAEVQ